MAITVIHPMNSRDWWIEWVRGLYRMKLYHLLSQTPCQIGLYVFYCFKSHCKAEQALGNAGCIPAFLTDPPVSGGGGMRKGALGITEVGGDRNHTNGIHHSPCRFSSVLQFE